MCNINEKTNKIPSSSKYCITEKFTKAESGRSEGGTVTAK